MRVLFGPIGIMILFWVVVPESPWYHARRGDKRSALKSMHRLYGNIKDYNSEEEFGIIARTIQHENENMENGQARYKDVFKGINLVSSRQEQIRHVTHVAASNPDCHVVGGGATIGWSGHCADLCDL
jgi:hypothetical protein